MHGIKIPPQDFLLKLQGGLMHEGGRICGTLRQNTDLWWFKTQMGVMPSSHC